jgi:serralysin
MLRYSIVFAMLAGCVSDSHVDEPLTLEEFVAQATVDDGSGTWVVNGDEPIETMEAMIDTYSRYRRTFDLAHGFGTTEQNSIVNRVNGHDDVYSAAQAQNLTYCINKAAFSSSEYSALVTAMNSATGAWESAAGGGVNFIHDVAADANCRKNAAFFTVKRVCTGQYLAKAFFPSSGKKEILVDCTSFGNINPWSLAGIMRHELGHTLGLRHEHTRPESGTCFEDNNWRALTSYDAASVMHYPQCNGSNNGDLNLTASDKSGIAQLY